MPEEVGLRTAVIGLGLIGGSLAAALKKTNLCQEIIGTDIDESVVAKARQNGFIDRGTTSLYEVVPDADLIILATPVRHIIDTLAFIGPLVKKGSILMDVGSTKEQVVEAMNLLPEDVQPIGGHPMSGAVTSGLAGANADMFKGRVFILTPTQRTTSATLSFAENLVKQIGAKPLVLEPSYHDHLVAMMSHLPQVIPVALLATAEGAKDESVWTVAAGGFKESTRKVTDNIPMWVDVLLTNPQHIIEAIQALQEQLEYLVQQIEEGNESTLRTALEQAAATWNAHFG